MLQYESKEAMPAAGIYRYRTELLLARGCYEKERDASLQIRYLGKGKRRECNENKRKALPHGNEAQLIRSGQWPSMKMTRAFAGQCNAASH
jgi:hypothetical protein